MRCDAMRRCSADELTLDQNKQGRGESQPAVQVGWVQHSRAVVYSI